jgi:hypothetical protein
VGIRHSSIAYTGPMEFRDMNILENISPIATILSGITAGIIIVTDDHRIRLGMLAIQYVCVTSLVSLILPPEIALIKLVAGWLACIVLGITVAKMGWHRSSKINGALPTGWVFKMIAVLLVSTSAIGFGQFALLDFLGIQKISNASTLLLVGLGLLQIGLTGQPMGVGVGLLTILSGFEILYSSLEPSLAVMGLMASIHIGIAVAVSIITIDTEKTGDLEVTE